MTNTPSPDEDRELIERRVVLDALHERLPYPTEACAIVRSLPADRLEYLLSDRAKLEEALTDARNNILSLLGGFRDDMPDAAVKLFQAQAKQIDAALNRSTDRG